MKKKTHPHHHHHHHHPQRNRNRYNNNNNNSVFGLLQGLIFCRSCLVRNQLLPFVSALVGCFLFLFALVAFLSPPINHHRHHRFHYNQSLNEELEDEIDFRSHIGNTSTFLVPRAGGSLGDEIWTSSQSNIYYGCSQKSDKFQAMPIYYVYHKQIVANTCSLFDLNPNLLVHGPYLNHSAKFMLVMRPVKSKNTRQWHHYTKIPMAPKKSAPAFGCDADDKTDPSRFLMIVTSGGLNQQRTGITDAVVAAYILNSTLVVPKLDNRSYWKDQSNFSDIFDVDWFISYLSKDINIVKELLTIEGTNFHPYRMRVPRKCDLECYESRVLPLLEKKKVVMLTKFDYRLSNSLDTELQKLRCRANYHALRYTDPIREMGEKLVKRMQMKSERYIALHLRFESDMLAFSGCYFGGGDTERRELEQIRTRWETLPKRSPDKERRLGRCPLTPEEVGLLLRALGYGEDVHIYVASGEVYGGENTLSPFKQLFPNFHSKNTLATKEELAAFASYSSRMAALDFIVCNESDIFVTNNNGNIAKILAGRRRYFGYKTTIRPNAKKLYRLFLDRGNMTWEEFASRVRTHQIGFMGRPNESKLGKGEFHENPIACICEDSNSQSQVPNESQSQNQRQVSNQCQSQSGANSHSVQTNQSNIVKEQPTKEEHNVSLAQHMRNENGTRVEECYETNS